MLVSGLQSYNGQRLISQNFIFLEAVFPELIHPCRHSYRYRHSRVLNRFQKNVKIVKVVKKLNYKTSKMGILLTIGCVHISLIFRTACYCYKTSR